MLENLAGIEAKQNLCFPASFNERKMKRKSPPREMPQMSLWPSCTSPIKHHDSLITAATGWMVLLEFLASLSQPGQEPKQKQPSNNFRFDLFCMPGTLLWALFSLHTDMFPFQAYNSSPSFRFVKKSVSPATKELGRTKIRGAVY